MAVYKIPSWEINKIGGTNPSQISQVEWIKKHCDNLLLPRWFDPTKEFEADKTPNGSIWLKQATQRK